MSGKISYADIIDRMPGVVASRNVHPCVLMVDDNSDLLEFLIRLSAERGWTWLAAPTIAKARSIVSQIKPDIVLMDYRLPDGNGIRFACEMRSNMPLLPVIIMTGQLKSKQMIALCEQNGFPVMKKPFLATEMFEQIRLRLERHSSKSKSHSTRVPVTSAMSDHALKVFFCYSHKDERLRHSFETHLSGIKNSEKIKTWHDRSITAGLRWEDEIDRCLNDADLILLMISPDFLESRYCYCKEMEIALERDKKGVARVVPVILRPTDWLDAPFAKLQAVPKNGKAITTWSNRDRAYLDAAESIKRVVDELIARKTKVSATKSSS